MMISPVLYVNIVQVCTDQPKKKALFTRFAAEHPLREIIFFAEKNKNHLFRRGISLRNFAEKLREISRRNSARFCGETPRNFAMGSKGPKVTSCVQRGLWSDWETEWVPSLIWVFTRRIIKPTQDRPNIITGCATTGEEQCTGKCNFIF